MAFVLTEYFSSCGVIRSRKATILAELLDHGDPGNYNGMVCSFITSTEYQSASAPR